MSRRDMGYSILIVGHSGCQRDPKSVGVQAWMECADRAHAERTLERFRRGELELRCPGCKRPMPRNSYAEIEDRGEAA